jgi:hypothetical protein
MMAGADADVQGLSIIRADRGETQNGRLIMDVVEGERFVQEVELNAQYRGALKVVANEI